MAVGDLLRSATIGDELRENDEELMIAMQRLYSITRMLVGASPVPIAEVHVSPLSLLQTRITDVKEICLYVALPQMATAEVVSELTDIAKALLLGEFDDIKVEVEVVYKCGVKGVPTILMYSIFSSAEPLENVLTDAYYWTAHSIVNNLGYDISIPCNFGMQLTKTMFIHISDPSVIVGLKKNLDSIGLGLDFVECLAKAKKSEIKDSSVCYLPMRSCRIMGFDIPYYRISPSSFNPQFVESHLNGMA